jgi:hypothetical protein
MRDNGKTYFTFDRNGKITADFDLMEKLRSEYENEKNNPTKNISDSFEELPEAVALPTTSEISLKQYKEAAQQDLASYGKLAFLAAEVVKSLKKEQQEEHLSVWGMWVCHCHGVSQ